MWEMEYDKDSDTWLVSSQDGEGLAKFEGETAEEEAYDFIACLEAEEGREDYLNQRAKILGQSRIPT